MFYNYNNYSETSIYGLSDSACSELFKKLENTLPAVFSRQEAANSSATLSRQKHCPTLTQKEKDRPQKSKSAAKWLTNKIISSLGWKTE